MSTTTPAPTVGHRDQAEARRVLRAAYPFRCCAVCGLQIATCLQAAHLDHNPGNNAPGNLAWLCPTHHWMYDAHLYSIDAIKLLQAHWQKTGGKPDHSDKRPAAIKAGKTRKRRVAASKAAATLKERRKSKSV